MKRLILMRHSKTEPWYQGGDDRSRALLPRGKSDARLVAEALKRREWLPDHVLVSSARRTRETWLELKPLVPQAECSVLDELYLAGTSAIEDLISEHSAAETLMLIGHNPGMHDLAVHLTSRAGTVDQQAAKLVNTKMPTSATALFEAAEDTGFHTSTFRLQDFIIAKSLRPKE